MADPVFNETEQAVVPFGWDGTGFAALRSDALTGINSGVEALNSLVPSVYDSIVLSYTGSNLTGVVYKLAAVTVSTLTLSYTGSNLTSVVKT